MAKARKPSNEVKIDRRKNKEQRSGERRTSAVAVTEERRTTERRQKAPRRRQIDPTTCERDYTDEEIEFMRAMDLYKRSSGRMFPTCSEILEVVRDLGYVKQDASGGSSPAPVIVETEIVQDSVEESL